MGLIFLEELMLKAWKQLGINVLRDGANGGAIGAFWFLGSIDATTRTRSYARTAYYEPNKGRSNLHLLTGRTVTRLVLEEKIVIGVMVDIQYRTRFQDRLISYHI